METRPPPHPLFRLALFGWATGALFFFYAWITRVAPSVMIDELMRDFAVGAAAIGNLSAFYFYGYAGMQIPVGLLMDRFGPRRLMTVAAAGCAAGCVMFALAPALWALSLGRFLIGATAAFSLVGAMTVAGQWFPASTFRAAFGSGDDVGHGRRRVRPSAATPFGRAARLATGLARPGGRRRVAGAGGSRHGSRQDHGPRAACAR